MKDLKKAVGKVMSKYDKQDLIKSPTPLFDMKSVFKSSNILTRLLRIICIRENKTIGDLDYGLRNRLLRSGTKLSKFGSDKNNILTAIAKESVTFNRAMELLEDIFGESVDITIHLKDKNGKERSYRYSEEIEKCVEEINKLGD